ncbi:hypothetical protein AVEN_170238-1 [Araneus ventricosus]|uniref:Uncharacterized protein n=1 Tax=Araneus ventricosus TaxID=182803 RepID=A0A4Y2BNQ7_ARAVE|nr:hypothetical protein AVEN_170238-1 [Araneus ventricosus]
MPMRKDSPSLGDYSITKLAFLWSFKELLHQSLLEVFDHPSKIPDLAPSEHYHFQSLNVHGGAPFRHCRRQANRRLSQTGSSLRRKIY